MAHLDDSHDIDRGATATSPTSPSPDRAGARRAVVSVPADLRVTFGGVLLSEWIKLRSVRSTVKTYVAAIGLLLFFGLMAAAFTGGLLTAEEGQGPDAGDPTSTVLGGSMIVALVMGTLGAIVMTSEYATSTIRSTMAFVPRRLPVLWAKAVVLIAVTLPLMVLATLVTFLLGQAVLGAGDAGIETATLGDPGVLRAVLGTAAYLTGVTVLGLAFGALLRTTSTALTALFALIFLVPGLGGILLPVSIQDNVLLYLPSNAASAFTSVTAAPGLLSAGAGAAVFTAWVLVPLLAAAVALLRRPV